MINGKYILPFLMASILSDDFNKFERPQRSRPNLNTEPVKPPIPKGCKEFKFDSEFGVFKTIAISKKSAEKKFQNWLNQMYEQSN
jgi:prophage antirepressor-like protein